MDRPNPVVLDLFSLSDGIPAVLPEMVGFYAQSCMVCLDHNSHQSGVEMFLQTPEENVTCRIIWSDEITREHHNAFADLIRATDHAACAIALLLIREFTEFTAVEQAVIGTHVDYWLRRKEASTDDKYIFNDTARLEVSGILQESRANTVENRVTQKLNRLDTKTPPAYVIVVEFSRPHSRMVEHG